MYALILPLLCSSAFAVHAGVEAHVVAVAQHDQEETILSHEAKMASVSLLQAHVSVSQYGPATHTHAHSHLQTRTGEAASSQQELEFTAGTSTSMLSTWQEAFQEDPALFDGCSKVFIDVGANRGTHVRKLFEPVKYPKSTYLRVFNESFGSSRSGPSSETGICAFGFEANPRWASTLRQIEKAYGAQGWRAKFFAPVAVSNKSGQLTLWLNNNGKHNDWGASESKSNPSAEARIVPAVDLSGFMRQLSARALPGYKLMKMDIEGAEYTVLPKLLGTNMLCKSALDKLTIEWHSRTSETGILSTLSRFLKHLVFRALGYVELDTDVDVDVESAATKKQVMSPTKCGGQPATMVVNFDDESYVEDGLPLP